MGLELRNEGLYLKKEALGPKKKALKPKIKVSTLKMSPGDQVPPPRRPLAMTDSQLRMVALLQG